MATGSETTTNRDWKRTVKHLPVLMSGLILLALIQCHGQSRLASQQLTAQQQQLAADLKNPTKNYLVEKFGQAGFGGKSFCAFKVLDVEQGGQDIHEYVFAACQEFYLKGAELTRGTALGLPVALLLRKESDGYKVISHEAPGDGGQFSRDVERIFPKKTHEEIYSAGLDYKSWQGETEMEAKQYFGK
jgi:hypothetical protein